MARDKSDIKLENPSMARLARQLYPSGPLLIAIMVNASTIVELLSEKGARISQHSSMNGPEVDPDAANKFILRFSRIAVQFPLKLTYREWLQQDKVHVINAYYNVLRTVIPTGYPLVDSLIDNLQHTSHQTLDALSAHGAAPHLPREFWLLLEKRVDLAALTLPQRSESPRPRSTDTPTP